MGCTLEVSQLTLPILGTYLWGLQQAMLSLDYGTD